MPGKEQTESLKIEMDDLRQLCQQQKKQKALQRRGLSAKTPKPKLVKQRSRGVRLRPAKLQIPDFIFELLVFSRTVVAFPLVCGNSRPWAWCGRVGLQQTTFEQAKFPERAPKIDANNPLETSKESLVVEGISSAPSHFSPPVQHEMVKLLEGLRVQVKRRCARLR
eukprot:scaffold1754_cov180-Ochromonas_danica.AAC.30